MTGTIIFETSNIRYPEKHLRHFMKYLISAFLLLGSLQPFSQPVITTFSPSASAAGTVVRLNGGGFSSVASDNIVYFGAVRASVISVTDTALTVMVPTGATYSPISVTTNGLTGWSSQPFQLIFKGGGTIFKQSFQFAAVLDSVSVINGDADNRGLAVGDFNADGRTDLAVVDWANSTLGVYKNLTVGDSVVFAPRLSYSTGKLPRNVFVADLEGDGRLDLVVANSDYDGSSVSVYKNISSGGDLAFDTPITFATGKQPSAVVIRDFDGDGRPDLAVANTSIPGSVSILRNISTKETILFAPSQSISVDGTFSDVKAGDFDSDDKPDLVFSNFTMNNVVVLRNTSVAGQVSFGSAQAFATGSSPSGISIGDMDGDGKPDLAVANFGSNSISLFRNASSSGTIVFTSKKDVTNLNGPTDVTFSDLDGDGKVDLLVNASSESAGSSSISVLENYSSPGSINMFVAWNHLVIGHDKVLTADMDADGRPDLVVSGAIYHAIVFKNLVGTPAIGSFSPSTAGEGTTVYIEGENFAEATAVDFGGVPVASFVVESRTTIAAVVGKGASGKITVHSPYGSGAMEGFVFASEPMITGFSPAVAGSGLTVRINGANFSQATSVNFGAMPAASFSIVSPSEIRAVVGQGAESDIQVIVGRDTAKATGFLFASGPVISSFSPLAAHTGSTVLIAGTGFHPVADSNVVYFGSVKGRVIEASQRTILVEVPLSASYKPITVTVAGKTSYSRLPFTPTFQSAGNISVSAFPYRSEYNLGGSAYYVQSGDLNGDGKIDLAVSENSTKRVAIFRNTATWGEVSFATMAEQTLRGAPQGLKIGDIDGDGTNDLLVLNFKLSVFKGNIAADTIPLHLGVETGSGQHVGLDINDVNADGRIDVAASTDRNSLLYLNTSTGDSLTFAAPLTYQSSYGEIHTVGLGDFNDDGKPDLVAVNGSDNDISVFKNISTAAGVAFGSKINFKTGLRAWGLATGDLNGDGKLDIVITHFDFNTITVFLNTSTASQISFNTVTDIFVGSQPRSVAIGDLNGDGRPDIVTANALSNTLSILENTSTPGKFSFSRTDIAAGSFPQFVVIDDLDGDGRPDLAVANYEKLSILRNYIGTQLKSGCIGSPTTLVSSITGRQYQWQVNAGNGFEDLADDSLFSGSLTAALTIHNTDSTLNARQFRCRVDGSYSSVFEIMVRNAPPQPTITASDSIFCTGNNVKLYSSAAAGNQWYRNGVEMAGKTDVGVVAWEGGTFTVVSTVNGCASPAAVPVVLETRATVYPAISIQTSGCSSGTLTFTSTVANGGNAPVINWYVNQILAGSGASLTLNQAIENSDVYATLASNASCVYDHLVMSATTKINCITTAVTDIEGLEKFEVGPNPTRGMVVVKFDLKRTEKVSFEITNSTGRKIFFVPPQKMQGSITREINMSGQAAGVYFLKTIIGEKSTIQKIIVQRS